MSLVEFCADALAALLLRTNWRSFCKGNLWCLFMLGKPDPRHQMLQKKFSAVMIVVIITTDLCHSNPTGVKRFGESSAFVGIRANYQLFWYYVLQSNSIKL